MSLFNKLKNLFYEEDEVEVVNEPKKAINPEIFDDVSEVKEPKKEIRKDVNNVVSERELFNSEPTFPFPVIFEDADFVDDKPQKKGLNVLQTENQRYVNIVKENTKSYKEEKKNFHPTPIISPIYGVLDKNYKKDEVRAKDGLVGSYNETSAIDIDSVRQKAYGEVSTREEKFYTNGEKPVLEKESDTVIDLFKEEPIKTEPLIDFKKDTKVYVENEYDLDEIDKKIKSIDDLLKETNDDDFYSLVDSMYKDEGEEE